MKNKLFLELNITLVKSPNDAIYEVYIPNYMIEITMP